VFKTIRIDSYLSVDHDDDSTQQSRVDEPVCLGYLCVGGGGGGDILVDVCSVGRRRCCSGGPGGRVRLAPRRKGKTIRIDLLTSSYNAGAVD
jgi:hypothetical protein